MERLIARLMEDEGFSSTAYKCPGDRLTIGYGRNIESKGITEEEARMLLMNDINQAEGDLARLFGAGFWAQLDDVRQWALINMRFQLGGAGFRGFKKAIAAIRLCSWKEAGAEILDSQYARQVPGRAQRVANEIIRGV